MRDLAFCCALKGGEGRDLVPARADVTMHRDATDVGYGGILGFDEFMGSKVYGRVEVSVQRPTARRRLREFRAVRLLLHRNFSGYVSEPASDAYSFTRTTKL